MNLANVIRLMITRQADTRPKTEYEIAVEDFARSQEVVKDRLLAIRDGKPSL